VTANSKIIRSSSFGPTNNPASSIFNYYSSSAEIPSSSSSVQSKQPVSPRHGSQPVNTPDFCEKKLDSGFRFLKDDSLLRVLAEILGSIDPLLATI